MQTDTLKIEFNEIDVTALVTQVTVNENIDGFIRGNIDIIDGTSLETSMFSKGMPVGQLEIEYLGAKCKLSFVCDGKNRVASTPGMKGISVAFVSAEKAAMRMEKINSVYEGTSDNIVGAIFSEVMGEGASLVVSPRAVSKGKYVVPNIAAMFAINNVVRTAIDENQSGYYFYQTLWNSGALAMTSLRVMNEKFTLIPGSRGKQGSGQTGKYYCLQESAPSGCDLEDGNIANVGVCQAITHMQYNKDYLERLAMGLHGNQSVENSLETTTINAHEATQITADALYTYKLSTKLYDGISPEDYFEGVKRANLGPLHAFYWGDISMSTDAQRFDWIGDGTMTGPATTVMNTNSSKYGEIRLGKVNGKSARYDSNTDGQLAKWIDLVNFPWGFDKKEQTKNALSNISILEGERNRISNGIKVVGDISTTSQSLFENMNSPTMIQMYNQKARAQSIIVRVNCEVAIPRVTCGSSINVKLQQGDKVRDVAEGNYIIKDLTHNFLHQDDNKFNYTQNYTLIRETES